MSLPSGSYYILSNHGAVGLRGVGPAPEPVRAFPFDDRMRTFGKWQVDQVGDSPERYRLTVVGKHTGAAGAGDARLVMASNFEEPSAIDWVLRQVDEGKYQIEDPATEAVWVASGVFQPVRLLPPQGYNEESFDFIRADLD